MKENGNVKNYSKDKGYEIIPRDLLQNEVLSLQAIGLLCNLQSYPENWVLHKTEVYKRFKKNGKTSVSNAWEELVKEKYIVQFRKRNGRKWDYIYYFNLEPFTNEQIDDLEEKEKAKSTSFRSKGPKENNDILGFRFSEPQNGNPKMGTPKPESKILGSKDITHELEEEDIYKGENFSFIFLQKELKEKNIDQKHINEIISLLEIKKINELNKKIIKNQYNHMMQMINNGTPIYNFAKYFVNGIEEKIKQKKASNSYQAEQFQKQQDRNSSDYYDWVNDDHLDDEMIN